MNSPAHIEPKPALPPLPAPQDLVAQNPGPAIWADAEGDVLAWNEPAEPLALALAEAPEAPLRAAFARVATTGKPAMERLRLPAVAPDPARTFDLSLLPHGGGALAVGRETTLETHLTGALMASRKLFKDLVACSSDFAWETDDKGRFCFVSKGGALGFSTAELNQRVAAELLAARPAKSEPLPFSARAGMKDIELWLLRADGGAACMLTSSLPVFDEDGRWTGARGVCRDVTELRAAQARLLELSRTDELTGLLNRRAFEEETSRRLRQLRRTGRWGALLYFDLDNFKAVNDSRGHNAGDEVLQTFAKLMNGPSRGGDVAARVGGDEFALWLDETNAAGALRKAELLARAFESLLPLSASPEAPLTVSIGIAGAQPGFGGTVADLVAAADRAMYRAKKSGKGRISMAGEQGEEPC